MVSKRSVPLILAIATLTLVFSAQAYAQTTPEILLTPDLKTVDAGKKLAVKVEVVTGEGNGVNSYIASLSYPEDRLTFDSINTDGSPFSMALEAKGGDGKVKIIRGSTKTVEGKLFAATVNFTAKTNTGGGVVSVEKDSAIIRSSDNSNILPGSTVQNTGNSGGGANSNMMGGGQMAGEGMDYSNWFSGFFNFFKNIFSSWFK